MRRELHRFRVWVRRLLCAHVFLFEARVPGQPDRVQARCNWCGARKQTKLANIIG